MKSQGLPWQALLVGACLISLITLGMCACAPSYTLSYDGNGSTGGSAPSSQFISKGTIASNSFINADNAFSIQYRFTGWNTANDGTGTSYAAGDSITLISDLVLYAQWDTSTYIGCVSPSGGYVFYDNGSTTAAGWRFLEAYYQDLGPAPWLDQAVSVSGLGTARGDGLANTNAIVAAAASNTSTNYAAALCANLVVADENHNQYTDWYLPNGAEFVAMFTANLPTSVSAELSTNHWVSQESDSTFAPYYHGGSSSGSALKTGSQYLRPIRRF
jgi:hypothetical protein